MAVLTDPPLPNPFQEFDDMRTRMEALERRVANMELTTFTQSQCIGLLMRAENIRLDRKMKNGNDK